VVSKSDFKACETIYSYYVGIFKLLHCLVLIEIEIKFILQCIFFSFLLFFRIDFPREVLRKESLLTNLVIDETMSEDKFNCEDLFVYITDTVVPGKLIIEAQKKLGNSKNTKFTCNPQKFSQYGHSRILDSARLVLDDVKIVLDEC
jgi:hypothetical protein